MTDYLYRVLITEYPEGSTVPGWEPPGWPGAYPDAPVDEDGMFRWPSVAHPYLSKSGAQRRRRVVESYGATAVVQKSGPVTWPEGYAETVPGRRVYNNAAMQELGYPAERVSLTNGVEERAAAEGLSLDNLRTLLREEVGDPIRRLTRQYLMSVADPDGSAAGSSGMLQFGQSEVELADDGDQLADERVAQRDRVMARYEQQVRGVTEKLLRELHLWAESVGDSEDAGTPVDGVHGLVHDDASPTVGVCEAPSVGEEKAAVGVSSSAPAAVAEPSWMDRPDAVVLHAEGKLTWLSSGGHCDTSDLVADQIPDAVSERFRPDDLYLIWSQDAVGLPLNPLADLVIQELDQIKQSFGWRGDVAVSRFDEQPLTVEDCELIESLHAEHTGGAA